MFEIHSIIGGHFGSPDIDGTAEQTSECSRRFNIGVAQRDGRRSPGVTEPTGNEDKRCATRSTVPIGGFVLKCARNLCVVGFHVVDTGDGGFGILASDR